MVAALKSKRCDEFESHLNAHPDDWKYRLVYADWLEEQRDAFCETQRWMVAFETCPDCEYRTWDWWSPKHSLLPSDLPEHVFDNLCDGRETDFRFREYPTRHAAELDLHNALVRAGEIHCALIEEVEA